LANNEIQRQMLMQMMGNPQMMQMMGNPELSRMPQQQQQQVMQQWQKDWQRLLSGPAGYDPKNPFAPPQLSMMRGSADFGMLNTHQSGIPKDYPADLLNNKTPALNKPGVSKPDQPAISKPPPLMASAGATGNQSSSGLMDALKGVLASETKKTDAQRQNDVLEKLKNDKLAEALREREKRLEKATKPTPPKPTAPKPTPPKPSPPKPTAPKMATATTPKSSLSTDKSLPKLPTKPSTATPSIKQPVSKSSLDLAKDDTPIVDLLKNTLSATTTTPSTTASTTGGYNWKKRLAQGGAKSKATVSPEKISPKLLTDKSVTKGSVVPPSKTTISPVKTTTAPAQPPMAKSHLAKVLPT
jgi:hypothetical protein